MIRNISVDRNDYTQYVGMTVRNAHLYVLGVVKDVEVWVSVDNRDEIMFRLDNGELVNAHKVGKITSELIMRY